MALVAPSTSARCSNTMADNDVQVHCAVCNGWFAVGACACVFPPPVAWIDPYGPDNPEGNPAPALFLQCRLGPLDGEMEQLLATNVVNIEEKGKINMDWYTPLAMAARMCRLRVVRLLLENDPPANIHAHMRTILHLVIRMGVRDRPAMVKLLLDHGADVQATDQNGFTPLHAAANRGDPALVRMLIHHGGNKMARTNFGETVADVATRRNVGTGTHDAVLEVIQTETLPRAKGVAFAMGLHERLGVASPVKALDKEVVRMVLELVLNP
jgi:hypothetical protein